MTPQKITPKPPALLEPPDRETNLAKAQLIIAQTWDMLPGGPISQNALKGYALSLLEIAETWERAEKLMQLIRTGCNRRPVPFEMRRIYEENIGVPADGIHDWQADQNEFLGLNFKRKAEDV